MELSSREREILALVSAGMSNIQIAKELYVSENTVKTYMQRVFAKLDVRNRTAAATQWWRMMERERCA